MIFVTVGTEKFQFNRLIQAVHEGVASGRIGAEVFAQTGSSTFRPELFSFENFIGYDKMVEYIRKADIVVAHAGEGTLLLCLRLGKIPILFPRQARFGEHLDDHQAELAGKMEERGKVLLACTEDELFDKIANYRDYAARLESVPDDGGKKRLIDFLRCVCLEKEG